MTDRPRHAEQPLLESLEQRTLLSVTWATSAPPAVALLAPDAGHDTVAAAISHTDAGGSTSLELDCVRKLTTSWPHPANIVYGTALSALQLNATASVAGTFTYSPAMGTVLHVGAAQTLLATFTPADKCEYRSLVVTTINVVSATLTITANNATKVYGAAVPPLSANFSGFVNGDSPASLSTSPTMSTTATYASPVLPGGYTIIASGASDPDYIISYRPGTLLITPAPLTITANDASMVQGTAMPPLTMTCSGLVNGDSPACLTTTPTLTTPATPLSPAGAYPIVVGGACSANYAITYANGVLTVTPAPVRILGVSLQTIHLGRLGKCKKTTQVIVLHFSGALDAGCAQNTNCYNLVTIACGKQQSKVVALAHATYNPADNSVKLTTRKRLVFGPSLRLTVAGLSDWLGRPLDGHFVAMLSKRGATITYCTFRD